LVGKLRVALAGAQHLQDLGLALGEAPELDLIGARCRPK